MKRLALILALAFPLAAQSPALRLAGATCADLPRSVQGANVCLERDEPTILLAWVDIDPTPERYIVSGRSVALDATGRCVPAPNAWGCKWANVVIAGVPRVVGSEVLASDLRVPGDDDEREITAHIKDGTLIRVQRRFCGITNGNQEHCFGESQVVHQWTGWIRYPVRASTVDFELFATPWHSGLCASTACGAIQVMPRTDISTLPVVRLAPSRELVIEP